MGVDYKPEICPSLPTPTLFLTTALLCPCFVCRITPAFIPCFAPAVPSVCISLSKDLFLSIQAGGGSCLGRNERRTVVRETNKGDTEVTLLNPSVQVDEEMVKKGKTIKGRQRVCEGLPTSNKEITCVAMA